MAKYAGWFVGLLSILIAIGPVRASCPPVPANSNCGFQANTPPTNCAAGMPGVEFWDCRLNCILTYIERAAPAPGQGCWRLVRGEFEPEGSDYSWQAHGGIYIYYKALDVSGNPIGGQLVDTTNFNRPGVTFYQSTAPGDNYWATQPMEGQTSTFTNCVCTTAQVWPYTGWIDETNSPAGYVGPSDKVHGMGMTNPPFGTFCNAHVNFRMTFRWTPATTAVFSVVPTMLEHQVVKGQSLTADTVMLLNEGGSVMHYTISDNATWLSETPTSGNLNPQVQTPITITYNPASLNLGLHQATITFSDPNAVPPQATVAIRLLVKSQYKGDFDGDGDGDQEDFGHLQVCLTTAGEAADSTCQDARLDGDLDVDGDDVNIFLQCVSGAGGAPAGNCSN